MCNAWEVGIDRRLNYGLWNFKRVMIWRKYSDLNWVGLLFSWWKWRIRLMSATPVASYLDSTWQQARPVCTIYSVRYNSPIVDALPQNISCCRLVTKLMSTRCWYRPAPQSVPRWLHRVDFVPNPLLQTSGRYQPSSGNLVLHIYIKFEHRKLSENSCDFPGCPSNVKKNPDFFQIVI